MRIWLAAGLCLCALAAAACRSEPIAVRIAGSTSVQPVAEVLGEGFARQGGGRVSVQGGGSTAGVQAVLSGAATVGAISRRLTPEESSRGLREHTIGYDVLTVVVHPSNPVRGLTRQQLRAVFEGRVTDWAQVGGPPGSIHLVSREAGS
ncbi:MAG TPA: substrate-binding domain-containing protein, partial [Symbiobacteriaceae bacterium]|nr:substrate-binding domain-containing protein [Symbiobacteriaceae bacterium]